jgi:hypothetical protein
VGLEERVLLLLLCCEEGRAGEVVARRHVLVWRPCRENPEADSF